MVLTFSFTNKFYVFPSRKIFDHFTIWTFIIQNKNKKSSWAFLFVCFPFGFVKQNLLLWQPWLACNSLYGSGWPQACSDPPNLASQCWHDTCVPLHSATDSAFKLRYDIVHEIQKARKP